MIDFLAKRLEQVKQRRAAVQEQERLRAEKVERLKESITLTKSLLSDQRYQRYAELLRETKRSLETEREGLLQGEHDRDSREHQVAILTGRILQLDMILNTPDTFLALAESVETNGHSPIPQRSAARSPVRESGLVAAKKE